MRGFMCVLTSLFFINPIVSQKDCLRLDFSVSQVIENEGFHRNIKWLVELLESDLQDDILKCRLALFFPVSSEMYVNPDEIADLNRLGKLRAYVHGEVNVETASHRSGPHSVSVFLERGDFSRSLISLPVHLRYQRAVIGGGYGRVILPKPSLLLNCMSDTKPLCNAREKVKHISDITGNDLSVWHNVSYQATFDNFELLVPVGDIDDFPLVSIATLVLGCMGCLYILSLLKRRQAQLVKRD